ncbi:MAG: hypothetical protein JXB62_14715 [Pirellulales bacterium]|nr:hypothetical protein [Pirellulales bacterium]
MHTDDTGDRWTAADGSAREPAAEYATMDTPRTSMAHTEVLARMPDLDAADRPDGAERSARRDGRILGQAISTKLLFGGGLLLVLAAVIPYWLNSSGEPKPGTSPAPNAAEAPAFDPQAASAQPQAPNVLYEPNMSFAPEIPPGPDFVNPTGDAGANPQTLPSGGPLPGTAPGGPIPGYNGQDAAPVWGQRPQQPGTTAELNVPRVSVRPRETAYDGPGAMPGSQRYPAAPPSINVPARVAPSPGAAGMMQPGSQGPPVGYDRRLDARPSGQNAYPSQPQANTAWPKTSANRPMAIPVDSFGRAVDTGPRANPQTDWRAGYPPHYQADTRSDPGYGYPSTVMQQSQPAQPGVARFEGIIEKPSVRTTDERARSSIH